MKASTNFSNQWIVILALAFTEILMGNSKAGAQVTGKLVSSKSDEAVAYASVAMIKGSDSSPVSGTTSDENGLFTIAPVKDGNYRLFVSVIGYKPVSRNIDVINQGSIDAGTILLEDTSIVIQETVIIGERAKAKSENEKTIFFMTKKMLDASNTGTDVLKFIPGVQIDLMQNISLEGRSNIQILVDGKERDASFISQLIPGQIDKVEVINKATSNYDGNTTGAINIILKKERHSGINGQIYAEIPTSGSLIFIRPSYSLFYDYKKLNLFTSYKGELTYLDIHEKTARKQFNDMGNLEINSNQFVNQKNWLHRFNYGFDYILNTHNQFNFYAFYNPYSRELDGNADTRAYGGNNESWEAKKEDTDRNQSTFYSLYYKHDFEKKGHALTFEMNNYNLNAENSTEYSPVENDNAQATRVNTVKPKQNEAGIKLDYTSPIGSKITIGTGIKYKHRILTDRYVPDFVYSEQIYAAYGTIGYKEEKYDLNLGGRAEKSISTLENNFNNSDLSFFPHFNFSYKISSRQNIQLAYNRSITRPNIYQLNPSVSIDDPYTVRKGNPYLQAEFLSSLFLEHSVQFKGNYFSSRLFYNKLHNAMDDLTFINDTSAFESQVNNMGEIQQFGIQFLGTIRFGILTFNPYIRFFSLHTFGNSLAEKYEVNDKDNLGFDSGLSSILTFKHELSLSLVFQYSSPTDHIQTNSFSDALYFLSLEKTFKQKIKIGITTALPFCNSFTYQGSEIDGSDFHSRYEGNVKISSPFCWFKISYQFNSGKDSNKINRETEEINNLPKKGF